MSRVIHFEVPADDPKRAMKFYEKVFDWQFEKWDGPMEYWLIMTGEEDKPGIDGGLSRREDPTTNVENTIDVKDLDAALANVKTHGGEIIRTRMAVPGIGWMAYIKDTEGNVFGLMQADEKAA